MGAVNPPQQSTGGKQSIVTPSQPLQQSRSHTCLLPNMVVHLRMPAWWLMKCVMS